jgi:hypothetical protein
LTVPSRLGVIGIDVGSIIHRFNHELGHGRSLMNVTTATQRREGRGH